MVSGERFLITHHSSLTIPFKAIYGPPFYAHVAIPKILTITGLRNRVDTLSAWNFRLSTASAIFAVNIQSNFGIKIF